MDWRLYLDFGNALLGLGKPAKALRMFWAAREDPEGAEALLPFLNDLRRLEEQVHADVNELLRIGRGLAAEPFEAPPMWKSIEGKWIELDGVRTLWHACTTAENFLDRGTDETFDPTDSRAMARLLLYLIQIGRANFDSPEVTECCACHVECQVPRCLVNDLSDFVCSACGTEQTMAVFQLTPVLEEAFQISSPVSAPVVFTAVPRQHPELDTLLLRGAVTVHKAVDFFPGVGGAPWWPFYARLPL